MHRFRERMDNQNPEWELSVIFGRINLFYFTGTMQDSMLIIPRDDDALLWVRRSYERALDESGFPRIRCVVRSSTFGVQTTFRIFAFLALPSWGFCHDITRISRLLQ